MFRPLGELPNGKVSQAFGISGNGAFVVGSGTFSSVLRAFDVTSGGVPALIPLSPSFTSSAATGCSVDGNWVAGYEEGTSTEQGFLFLRSSQAPTLVPFPTGFSKSVVAACTSGGSALAGLAATANAVSREVVPHGDYYGEVSGDDQDDQVDFDAVGLSD
jgi:hypothetical protein